MSKDIRKLNYAAWLGQPRLNPAVRTHATNLELHPPANAFLSNMERVDDLGRLPFLLMALGVSGGFANVLTQMHGNDIGVVLGELHARPNWHSELSTTASDLADKASNSTVPDSQKAFRTLSASLLISSYGALESLFVDLIHVLRELRPEMRDRLPTEMKVRPVGRKNLESFRKIYERMFPEGDSEEPHRLLEEFAKNYRYLLVLEAARNLFSHRCGIVDARFVELVKTSSALSKLQASDELVVDFEMARALAGVSFEFGVYLIKFCDWWLNKHPPLPDTRRTVSE